MLHSNATCCCIECNTNAAQHLTTAGSIEIGCLMLHTCLSCMCTAVRLPNSQVRAEELQAWH